MNEQQKVQRYEPSGPGFGGVRQADDGDFVLYCDYDQLRQRVAHAEERRRQIDDESYEYAEKLQQAEAKLALAEQDARRLDWLTAPEAIDRHVYQCVNGEWCAQEDVLGAWYGATPREAIDAAIASQVD